MAISWLISNQEDPFTGVSFNPLAILRVSLWMQVGKGKTPENPQFSWLLWLILYWLVRKKYFSWVLELTCALRPLVPLVPASNSFSSISIEYHIEITGAGGGGSSHL